MTARIPVGSDWFALVDDEDVPLVAGRKWHPIHSANGRTYAWSKGRRVDGMVLMHRLIDGTPAGLDTDHINSDGLDNRRSNLRAATRSQNLANMRKPCGPNGATATSIYKGVSWDRTRTLWQAGICVRGHHKKLGRFESQADAARAYDAAALAAWGELARLNFPADRVAARPDILGNEIPDRLDERYDPSPEPITRKVS